MFDPSQLFADPLIYLAFGAGCASGYGFAIKTAYKAIKERLDKVEAQRSLDEAKCDAKILALQTRQRELEDMLLGRRALGVFSPPARSEIETEAERR